MYMNVSNISCKLSSISICDKKRHLFIVLRIEIKYIVRIIKVLHPQKIIYNSNYLLINTNYYD